jgi:hypothetical protein
VLIDFLLLNLLAGLEGRYSTDIRTSNSAKVLQTVLAVDRDYLRSLTNSSPGNPLVDLLVIPEWTNVLLAAATSDHALTVNRSHLIHRNIVNVCAILSAMISLRHPIYLYVYILW